MPYVPEEAIKRYQNNPNITSKELEGISNSVGDPASPRTARRWHLYLKEGVADAESLEAGTEQEVTSEEMTRVKELLVKNKNGLTTIELSEYLDRSPSSVLHITSEMREQGYNIYQENNTVTLVKEAFSLPTYNLSGVLADSMVVKIAVLSDLHCGSKHEQITHRKAFVQYAREQGYRKFFVPGDLCTGIHVYKGHALDTYALQSEQQEYLVEEAVKPLDDEDWFILGGNHDFSWIKNSSVDIIWRVCQKYEQLHFLGYDLADVKLTDKHAIRLWHPSGGVTYAASYRIQKGIEQVLAENSMVLSELVYGANNALVKTIFAGHLHRDASVHEGGMFAMLASCFEGQTSYLARKPLYPRIAGNLYTFYLNDAGNVAKMISEHVPFVEIKEDYRKYPFVELGKPEELEPIFKWGEQDAY